MIRDKRRNPTDHIKPLEKNNAFTSSSKTPGACGSRHAWPSPRGHGQRGAWSTRYCILISDSRNAQTFVRVNRGLTQPREKPPRDGA